MYALILLIVLATMTPPNPAQPVTFERDIKPILERRCTPCHFTGGKMYARLPFDRAETITKLGEKLFTRIKQDDEQKVIRAFLAASAKPAASSRPAPPAPATRPRAKATPSNAARAPRA